MVYSDVAGVCFSITMGSNFSVFQIEITAIRIFCETPELNTASKKTIDISSDSQIWYLGTAAAIKVRSGMWILYSFTSFTEPDNSLIYGC